MVRDNLRRVLSGVGAGFEHIVCVRAFLVHFERDYAAFNRVYAGYFAPDRLPVRTTVGVTALAHGGIVEIDLITRRRNLWAKILALCSQDQRAMTASSGVRSLVGSRDPAIRIWSGPSHGRFRPRRRVSPR